MSTFQSRLLRREELAENTVGFYFEKPAGFAFQAGQFLDVDLTHLRLRETDTMGFVRSFSIASSPHDAELMVATRIRDTAFKKGLHTLPLRTEVKLEGPAGSFTLGVGLARPVVFLAGGIGVTPFLSMIRQAGQDHSPRSITLFYSNRRPEDAAFMEILFQQGKMNPHFRFVPTMTQIEKSRWKWVGEGGAIRTELIDKYVHRALDPVYLIAGPPRFVLAMRDMLLSSGVAEDGIRSDEFDGY